MTWDRSKIRDRVVGSAAVASGIESPAGLARDPRVYLSRWARPDCPSLHSSVGTGVLIGFTVSLPVALFFAISFVYHPT